MEEFVEEPADRQMWRAAVFGTVEDAKDRLEKARVTIRIAQGPGKTRVVWAWAADEPGGVHGIGFQLPFSDETDLSAMVDEILTQAATLRSRGRGI